MAGAYRTIVNTRKFSKITAIAIGVLITIPLLFFGFLTIQNVFTRANDAEPRDVIFSEAIEGEGDNQVRILKIQWTTGQATLGVVKYGTNPNELQSFAPEISKELATNHEARIPLLGDTATKYYFKIAINGEEYDDGGVPYDYTPVGARSSVTSAPGEVTEAPLPSSLPTLNPSITGAVTSLPSPTGAGTKFSATCTATSCSGVLSKLNQGCSSSDYLQCIMLTPSVPVTPSATPTITTTPGPTNTGAPTPTPIAMTTSSCAITYIQATNCRSTLWDSLATKPQACRDAFGRYFLQCKNNSFIPTPNVTPPADIWYFNNVITDIASNSATLPAVGAPTPVLGSTMYCQVRAEDTVGGDGHATQWMYVTKPDCT